MTKYEYLCYLCVGFVSFSCYYYTSSQMFLCPYTDGSSVFETVSSEEWRCNLIRCFNVKEGSM
jgi:hypothetical protein